MKCISADVAINVAADGGKIPMIVIYFSTDRRNRKNH